MVASKALENAGSEFESPPYIIYVSKKRNFDAGTFRDLNKVPSFNEEA